MLVSVLHRKHIGEKIEEMLRTGDREWRQELNEGREET